MGKAKIKPPAQHQNRQPGQERKMTPRPQAEKPDHQGTGKLAGKVALITGGDSGIGRAVAVAFAKEGADVSILYLDEYEDAQETKRMVEQKGRRCLLMAGDISEESLCREAVKRTVQELGGLNVLVNNAARQEEEEAIEKITAENIQKTFQTNIFSMFYLAKYAVPHMKKDDAIINTTSVTAYRGSDHLLSYSATKGAIVTFTRALSKQLVKRGIRVNAVAPGPVWTPLIPATFDAKKVAKFGQNVPMERPGQPEEIAPCYVFLASSDASYMSGQVLHPNGGEIING